MADSGKLILFKPTRRGSPLTAKHVRFCELIFEGKSRTQAYLEAVALSPNTAFDTAKAAAWKLMRRQSIRVYLRELQEHAFAAARVSLIRILSTLASQAFADRAELTNEDGSIRQPRELPRDIRACLEAFEVEETYGTDKDPETGALITVVKSRRFKLKTSDRGTAIEKLMRFKKMLCPSAIDPERKHEPLTIGGEARWDAV